MQHSQRKQKRSAKQACSELIGTVAGKTLQQSGAYIARSGRKHHEDDRIHQPECCD